MSTCLSTKSFNGASQEIDLRGLGDHAREEGAYLLLAKRGASQLPNLCRFLLWLFVGSPKSR